MSTKYDKDSITSLDPIEHIRARPSVYIPDVDIQGLHHLVEEVLNNSVDEFIGGNGSKISIIVTRSVDDKIPDHIQIGDYGRGMPVGYRKDLGGDVLTSLFTKTLTGGKFDKDSYKTSSGLNGIGLKAVNALSSELTVSVRRDNKLYTQEFEYGIATTKVKESKYKSDNGTDISFTPDSIIFEEIKLNDELLKTRLFYLASILPGLEINYTKFDYDNITNPLESIKFKETEILKGIQDRSIAEHFDGVDQLFNYEWSNNNIQIKLCYHQSPKFFVNSFVNTIHTYDDGSHVDAIIKILSDSLKKLTGKLFSKSQLMAGIGLTISVFDSNPIYKGQHKGQVSDNKIKKKIYDILYYDFFAKLSKNQAFIDYLVELITSQERLIQELDIKKAITQIKNSSKENRLPAKLAIAFNSNPDERELFIVEGDSAGGSVKVARNPKFQEVLPIKGKIINAFKTQYSDLLQSEEVMDVFSAIGGMEDSNTPLRTKNVFLLADADPDAAHIIALLISLFTTVFPSFVKNHNLYVAHPPPFSLISGDIRMYGYSYKDLKSDFTKKHGTKKFEIHKNKGLGEMDPEELVPVVNPKSRFVTKIDFTKDTVKKLDSLMGLMGDIRRQLVQEVEDDNEEVV